MEHSHLILRRHAFTWITALPKGKVFHVSELYRYLRVSFPSECKRTGEVMGEPNDTYSAQFTIRDARNRGPLKHVKRGYWERT
jgi:hypothetical protein